MKKISFLVAVFLVLGGVFVTKTEAQVAVRGGVPMPVIYGVPAPVPVWYNAQVVCTATCPQNTQVNAPVLFTDGGVMPRTVVPRVVSRTVERTVEPRVVVPRSTVVTRTAVVPSTTVVQTQVQAYQVVETPQAPFAVRGLFRDRVVIPRRSNVSVVPVL